MEKIIYCIAIITCALLTSCSADDYLSEDSTEEIADLLPTNCTDNILSFSSEAAYQSVVDSLSCLAKDELLEWEKEHNFYSMYHKYLDASDDILTSKTAKEYFAKKDMYDKEFIFNDVDSTDLSIYMPVLAAGKAVTLSPNGYVRIAGEIRCMNEFKDYSGYTNTVNRKYPIHLSRATIENGVNRVYVKTSDRKFTAQLSWGVDTQRIRVNASKKFLWGWMEYTTAYYWRFSPNGPIEYGKEVSSGNDIIIGNPFPNGLSFLMWSRGVGEENGAIMTVNL